MIKQLYILKQNGILLYSKIFKQSENEFEQDLLLGFFSSIANFSKEALNTVIENINLGKNEKVIIYPNYNEKILSVAIVSIDDTDELITSILREITQDFIDTYAPDYNPHNINYSEVDKIIKENLQGKIMGAKIKRFFVSWLILLPLSFAFSLFSGLIATIAFDMLNLSSKISNSDQLYFEFLPGMLLLISLISLIIYTIPCILSGFIVADKKLAILNSVLIIGIFIFEFLLNPEMIVIAYIIIAYFPMELIIVIFFSWVGINIALKKKLSP
ncbi:MAG: hypothetical protein ACTSU2_05625 [Promethearchaeota archaeon]